MLPVPPRSPAPRGGSIVSTGNFPSFPPAAPSNPGSYAAPGYDPNRTPSYPLQTSNPGSYSAAPYSAAAPQSVQTSNPGSYSAAPGYSSTSAAYAAPPLSGSQSVPQLQSLGGPPTGPPRNGFAPSSGRAPLGLGAPPFRNGSSPPSEIARRGEAEEDPYAQHHLLYSQTHTNLASLEDYTRHIEKANMKLKAKLLQVVKPTLVALFSRQEAVIKTSAFSYWKRYTHEHSIKFWHERYNEDKAALKREFQANVDETQARIEDMKQKNRDSEEQLSQAIAYAEELENDKEVEKARVVAVQAQLSEAEKCIEKLKIHTTAHLDTAGQGGLRYEKAKKQFANEEVYAIEKRQENSQSGGSTNIRPSTGELQSIKEQLDLLFHRINGVD